MATVDELEHELRQTLEESASGYVKSPLTDEQYSAGLDIVVRVQWKTYEDFIIPQLSQLLAPILKSRAQASILEIGPGPKSVLGLLPGNLRLKISKYTAFEPNKLFGTCLREWIVDTPKDDIDHPFPELQAAPIIHLEPYDVDNDNLSTNQHREKYDIILFCNSMYGMKPKHVFIEHALECLQEDGMLVVFHRDSLRIDGLASHRTAIFPAGMIKVKDEDQELDCFARFIAGSTVEVEEKDSFVRKRWRGSCRTLGHREVGEPDNLIFESPVIMVAFNKHAAAIPELAKKVPILEKKTVKNGEARSHHPACIARPTTIEQVQECVRWALKHKLPLTVIGGGHSGHCLWPNVVAVDMGAFDDISIINPKNHAPTEPDHEDRPLIVAGAGCKTGDIIEKAMAAGLTVPLGSRPSVGAGLWLQGGIGHLSRSHGLAADNIVGFVMVNVVSGDVFCVGYVPKQAWPANAERPFLEDDILDTLGTNNGIVVSVVFKAYPAPTYLVHNWVLPLEDQNDALVKLKEFDEVAEKLDRNCSADAYLYWDTGHMHLGVTTYTCSTITSMKPSASTLFNGIWGLESGSKMFDAVGLFETDMYVSGMHGGHGGGRTTSFKRCLFLKHIGEAILAERLVEAVESRPSLRCYLHLLQGGKAIRTRSFHSTHSEAIDVLPSRDWDFACVITGVWSRDEDGTEAARSAVKWVYRVAEDLLGLSRGVYAADLGPDPRDAPLVEKASGPNKWVPARLKYELDPHNILAFTFPLRPHRVPTLIILVTGDSCAGKDYCADVWESVLSGSICNIDHNASVESISEATKRDYAAVVGADWKRLLWDRAYKEQHRPALTAFYQKQLLYQPQLPEEHFLDVVNKAGPLRDVLLITGMRDEAPVAAFSHLVPSSRVLEVYIRASERTRRDRGSTSNPTALNHCPSFIFDNENAADDGEARRFAEQHLLPFLHSDLEKLASMVRSVPDFPRRRIEFRHVLGIAQHPGGLALCISLLRQHFKGDWAKIDDIVSCEFGGIVFASALAFRVDIPLVLIRKAGKLPPPTVSIVKSSSYISSLESRNVKDKSIEIGRDAIKKGASVVVVDDVLSSGETLCAVLRLLEAAGIGGEQVSIMVVAEFPAHRGRQLLHQRGFGKVKIQSLLVFGGE